VKYLVGHWKRPDVTVRRALKRMPGVWADPDARLQESIRILGSVWVGAGRQLKTQDCVMGPAVLWDLPEARPSMGTVPWGQIDPEPWAKRAVRPKPVSSTSRIGKRCFDVVFAAAALALTLPLYPVIMLAIWLEDGRPFFYRQYRETTGGREFGCLKFRSMRNDAAQLKAEVRTLNKADGPHVFIEDDPRQTAVGRFLRSHNIDELPQFINVLLGQMSVVGPRPTAYNENQFCPAWREARLSVKPGITGLWQVKRTRKHGVDFQEWIRYDIEYVENRSWAMELWIIWQTLKLPFRT
jgi:lipopolysaccharide/colanic/teichoic acid biosynthesis glycosyltransferase